jgi:hypothetical protein
LPEMLFPLVRTYRVPEPSQTQMQQLVNNLLEHRLSLVSRGLTDGQACFT